MFVLLHTLALARLPPLQDALHPDHWDHSKQSFSLFDSFSISPVSDKLSSTICQGKTFLAGHLSVLQGWDLDRDPSDEQSAPPFTGTGLVQFLVLIIWPTPHVRLQLDQLPHSVYPPFTVKLKLICVSDTTSDLRRFLKLMLLCIIPLPSFLLFSFPSLSFRIPRVISKPD